MFSRCNFACVLVLLCLVGVRSRAAAQAFPYPQGAYGWYEAGGSVIERAKLQDFFGNPVNGNPVEFDPGFHFGIAFGRQLHRYVKVEVESGFNYNALKSIGGAAASSGNLYRVPLMANLVLQFPNRTRLVPVLGAGAGGQWLGLDAQNIAYGSTLITGTSETWVFSYQGYAGVHYHLNDRLSLGLFYHYHVADGPSWNFGPASAGNFKLDSIRTHSLSLTLGWYF